MKMKGIKKWQAVLQVAQVAAATICKAGQDRTDRAVTFRPQNMSTHTNTHTQTGIKEETKHEKQPSN